MMDKDRRLLAVGFLTKISLKGNETDMDCGNSRKKLKDCTDTAGPSKGTVHSNYSEISGRKDNAASAYGEFGDSGSQVIANVIVEPNDQNSRSLSKSENEMQAVSMSNSAGVKVDVEELAAPSLPDKRDEKDARVLKPFGTFGCHGISCKRPKISDSVSDSDPLVKLFLENNKGATYETYFDPPSYNKAQREDKEGKADNEIEVPKRSSSIESGGFKVKYDNNSDSNEWPEYNPCLKKLKEVGHDHYSPHILADSQFVVGNGGTVKVHSYMKSIIPFSKAAASKKAMNDNFRARFPSIQLTFSKIRSLKQEMRNIVIEKCNFDIVVVAQAYAYLEKLILKCYVTKENRKYCAAVSILLAAKLNDIEYLELFLLIKVIKRTFGLKRAVLFKYEFAVMVALGFSLYLPTEEVMPHYLRVLDFDESSK